MNNRNVILNLLAMAAFGSLQLRKRLSRRRTAAIPAGTPQRAKTLFLLSPAAHSIQQLAGSRSGVTPPARSTQPLAQERFLPIPGSKIRLPALERF